MSAAKHTPGPWSVTQRYNALKDEIGVKGQAVCTVWTRQLPPIREQGTESIAWPEGESNARLIAAAPDYFAGAADLLRWAHELDADAKAEGFGGGSQTAKRIRAALQTAHAKATGNASQQPSMAPGFANPGFLPKGLTGEKS